MLLLVRKTEEYERLDLRGRCRVQQLLHMFIDVPSIGGDLPRRRACQQSPVRAGMAGTQRLVVRVEEVGIRRIEHLVASQVLHQQKGLEEPCGMREMPFRGTRVRHRLNYSILVFEGGDKHVSACTDPREAREQT